MKLENEETGDTIKKAWLTLTEDEARTLYEHLAALFEDDPILRPWHMHLGDESDVELNIELEDL
jgi:hypothetical protein